jgi:hypothetical protein
MDFRHGSFAPMELQRLALDLGARLNRMDPGSVRRILAVGSRGRGLRFAGTTLFVRSRLARQARTLLRQIGPSASLLTTKDVRVQRAAQRVQGR